MGRPSHFNAGAAAAQDLDAEDFFLPAVTIDIERQAAHDTDYAVSVDDLQAWVAEHGPFPDQCAVLLNTGWHKRWPTQQYASLDDNGEPATRILAGRGAVVTRRRRAGPARGAGHRCFQSRRRRR